MESEHTFDAPGVYWVYKYKDCYLTIDSFDFRFPEVRILEDDTIVCRLGVSEIQLHAEANLPGTFTWSTGESGPEANARYTGTYVVMHTNQCGVFTDSVKVLFNEDCDCQPFIPNAFSPNGDGLNDVFKVETICPTSHYYLSIYNRFGQKVFVSRHPEEAWSGIFHGRPLPAGTYYYLLDYEVLGYLKFQLKGDILLIR